MKKIILAATLLLLAGNASAFCMYGYTPDGKGNCIAPKPITGGYGQSNTEDKKIDNTQRDNYYWKDSKPPRCNSSNGDQGCSSDNSK